MCSGFEAWRSSMLTCWGQHSILFLGDTDTSIWLAWLCHACLLHQQSPAAAGRRILRALLSCPQRADSCYPYLSSWHLSAWHLNSATSRTSTGSASPQAAFLPQQRNTQSTGCCMDSANKHH